MSSRLITPFITFILIILLWHGIDFIFNIDEVIFPNPYEIIEKTIDSFSNLMFHLSITMLEAFLGFIAGSLLSILTAILFIHSNTAKSAFYPYAVGLKATPIYAIAPLLVLWFGNGIWAKVVMSAFVAYFPVLVAAMKGFEAVSKDSYDLFKSLGATKKEIFFKLRLPCSLSYIFPSLKTASTLSVVGATIAEFTGASFGIGYLIVNSSYYLDTSLMFSSIIFISIAGVLFFKLVDYIERKVVFWERVN